MKKAFVSYEKKKTVLLADPASHFVSADYRRLCDLRRGQRFRSAAQERRKAALQSVTRATVQCYAIEDGIHPIWIIWKKTTA